MTNMDLMALLSTVVLVATIATTVFAVLAYAASRGYIRKKVRTKEVSLSVGPPPLARIARAPMPARSAAAAAAAMAKKNALRSAPILKRYNPFA